MATSDDRSQLAVRVSPNAKASAFAGWTADEKGRPVLLLKIAATPVDGQANDELIRFLAKALDCPKSQLTLLRGLSSRQKLLELPAAMMERLPK